MVPFFGASLTLSGCALPDASAGLHDINAAAVQAADRPLTVDHDATQPAVAQMASALLRSSEQADDSGLSDAAGARPATQVEQTGLASWYGSAFNGRRTASGERYDMNALTAAHRTLPLGACVRVTSVGSAHSVVVRINDRGPFVRGRVIDLSHAAAVALGMGAAGNAQVWLERLTATRDGHAAAHC
ncbi:septal ring lytic transglycosylase RlpA family protein [Paraburkholderia sp. PREW-6R]|uniref:septal ring lytic transglycosylase RlpA family protein n=1 Tax=Paraburkholderia sp. PREW-6R TaxID=3141544 RepID=UPI0031F4A392